MYKKGFTLIEIFLVVAILGILIAMGVPNYLSVRGRVRQDMCINNLRQIKLAKEHWALENNKVDADTPATADLDPYIKDGTAALKCPLDPGNSFNTSYTINNVGTDPACKISPGNHKL
jgi:prepilin-type N-terminal cleavage/methylation domain-containing protein